MRRWRLLRLSPVVAWMLSLALTLQPAAILAQQPSFQANRSTSPANQPVIADVQLQHNGMLVGQVVNESGSGVAGQQIRLSNAKASQTAKTDADGWFRFQKIRGGVFQLRVDQQTQLVRAWTHGTAPTKASNGLLFTPPDDVFRGQRVLSPQTNQFFRVAKQRLANPLFVGGVIVTAVAIPVAIHNADDDPPATP